jgi:hypothetical protein
MPQVEIDEAELLRLRRTGEVISSMYKSPSAKRKLLEALKDVRPDDPAVKELETPDPSEARFIKLEQELAAERKARADSDAEREKNSKLDAISREQNAGFDQLRREKWTDDGIAKVKAVMEEKGILDVAIAAKWVESQMPPPADIAMPGGHGGAWNFADALATESDADLKRLIETKGENEGLLRKMAGEAIAEVRGVTGGRR